MKRVEGYGSSSAKLMIVGEAPGRNEEEQGLPFVGASGQLLDEALQGAGISRDEVYITNVCKIRPPENDIKRLNEIGYKIDDFIPELWAEVRDLNPNCILALGGTAFEVLTGLKGIRNQRGSILPNCQSYLPKVVGSLHPASLLHEAKGDIKSWKELQYIKFDTARAVDQSHFRDYNPPQRNLLIARTSLDVLRFLESGNNLAFLDVETCKTIPIALALAFNKYTSMSIPLMNYMTVENPEGIPLHDMVYIWKLIAEFLGDTKTKIGAQNAKFDQRICEDVGLIFNTYIDTAMAFHVLFPEMPKALQFISSILTEEPYYKDEYHDFNPKKDKFDKILLYNAKDSAVEFECWEEELEMLKEEKLDSLFFDKIMPLHKLYYDIESVGIKIDMDVRKRLKDKYEAKRVETHKIILDNCKIKMGEEFELNVNSPKQVHKYIYQLLNCPMRKGTEENTLLALMNNAVKDEPRRKIIQAILDERKISKTINTYIMAKTIDDRMKTVFNISGTETGRTSTSKRKAPVTVVPDGIAFQTLTKYGDIGADLREMFIPDDGYVFIEADGSQAEDRVCCVLARDWEGLDLLNKKDFKYNKNGLKDDRHTLTAMMVVGKCFEDITDIDRQVGKKTRHAFNLEVGKHALMLALAGENIHVSEWRAGTYIDKIKLASPKIKSIFHTDIVDALINNDCKLVNPFRRVRQFFNKWGDELFKEAYAFIPQSTVSDQVKFAMLPIKEKCNCTFVMESHDSFVALIKEDEVEEFCKIAKPRMESPIDFNNCSLSRDYQLVIPAEFKIYRKNLLEGEKIKL